MDAEERKQVELILDHEGEAATRATTTRLKAMHAEFSAKGTFRSGATIKRTVQIIEEEANSFIRCAINRVAPVAQDMDAFALISARLSANFRAWSMDLEVAVELVTAGKTDLMRSVVTAADASFTDMKARVGRELEIHRFTFTKPTKGTLAQSWEQLGSHPVPVTAQAKPTNPGGKPLAKHWDAMWAAISVKLWTGELNPKTQADLKKAIFDWFNAAEIDVGDTAVTQRARQLWQAMQSERS